MKPIQALRNVLAETAAIDSIQTKEIDAAFPAPQSTTLQIDAKPLIKDPASVHINSQGIVEKKPDAPHVLRENFILSKGITLGDEGIIESGIAELRKILSVREICSAPAVIPDTVCGTGIGSGGFSFSLPKITP